MTLKDPRVATILSELYQIDKTLENHEEALVRLITTIDTTRPTITINEAYVADLRATLLAYKQPVAASVLPTHSFTWWLPRLAPVGVALFVFVMVILPQSEHVPDTPVLMPTATDETMEIMPYADTPAAGSMRSGESTQSDSVMMTAPALKSASPQPIVVTPPLSGNLLMIEQITLSEPGWIVIYEDHGGNFGTILYLDRINPGLHGNLALTLNRRVSYGEMVTVVVYTAKNGATFRAQTETIQIDPVSATPLMVTVPVISELEMPSGQ